VHSSTQQPRTTFDETINDRRISTIGTHSHALDAPHSNANLIERTANCT